MKELIKKMIGQRHPLVLFYHKLKGWLAVTLYMNPSRKIKVIGITGTNGKTTTVNLVADLLEAAGYKVGLTSTVRYKVGDTVWSNRDKMTTQSPFFLQKMLSRMVKENCDYAVIEVTSHAVDQSRIYGINFDVVAITNLTGDHIEYHGSMEEYMHAKGKFIGSVFSMRRKKEILKTVIVNADDEYYDYFNQFKGDQKYVYGIKDGSVQASNIVLGGKKTSFSLKIPNDSAEIEMQLLGEFNVYNALLAISVGISQGLSLQAIAHALKTISPVGGRFEPVNVGQKFSVIVDYAHTPDALQKLLGLFKPLTKGKVILVFGCTGGGRDKAKRPVMGQVADSMADVIVLTDDDPYEEDRWQIIQDIAVGIKREEGDGLFKIIGRTDAIYFALNLAEEGDTVLIAGKGGEEVIVIGKDKIPYDDRVVVRHVLSESLYSDVAY